MKTAPVVVAKTVAEGYRIFATKNVPAAAAGSSSATATDVVTVGGPADVVYDFTAHEDVYTVVNITNFRY